MIRIEILYQIYTDVSVSIPDWFEPATAFTRNLNSRYMAQLDLENSTELWSKYSN